MIETPVVRDIFHSASKLTFMELFSDVSRRAMYEEIVASINSGDTRTWNFIVSGKSSDLRPYAAASGVRFCASDGNAV
jgi:hypothetical protein